MDLGVRAINIARKLGGQTGWEEMVPEDRFIVTVWDVFPARAQAEVQNRWIVRGLWSIWFGFVAATPGDPNDPDAAVHGP